MSGFKKIHLVEDSCVYEIYLKNDSKAQQTLDPLKEKSEQDLDWLKKKKWCTYVNIASYWPTITREYDKMVKKRTLQVVD